MGPLESLGHRESITAIASSGDSSQPSNEPFEGGHSTPFSRHFLNKKILWTSFLDPNFLVLSLSPWGGRKLWPPFTATFETRWKLQSQQTRQLEREDERAEAQLFLEDLTSIWWRCGLVKKGLWSPLFRFSQLSTKRSVWYRNCGSRFPIY